MNSVVNHSTCLTFDTEHSSHVVLEWIRLLYTPAPTGSDSINTEALSLSATSRTSSADGAEDFKNFTNQSCYSCMRKQRKQEVFSDVAAEQTDAG